MVILSEDPLAVDPMTIQDISVLKTLKKGETVFRVLPSRQKLADKKRYCDHSRRRAVRYRMSRMRLVWR
jgi:hypothetical protein